MKYSFRQNSASVDRPGHPLRHTNTGHSRVRSVPPAP